MWGGGEENVARGRGYFGDFYILPRKDDALGGIAGLVVLGWKCMCGFCL